MTHTTNTNLNIVYCDCGPESEERTVLPPDERYNLYLRGIGTLMMGMDDGTDVFHEVLHIPVEHMKTFTQLIELLYGIQKDFARQEIFYMYMPMMHDLLGKVEYTFRLFTDDSLEISIEYGEESAVTYKQEAGMVGPGDIPQLLGLLPRP